MQFKNGNNNVIEKVMLSESPYIKNIINWTPSICNFVPLPNGFDTNMKSKIFAIKTMNLPNSLVPKFVPTIKQTSNFYNPNGASGSIFNPVLNVNTLDYYWLFRNKSTGVVYGNYLYWQNNYVVNPPSVAPNNINSILTPYYQGKNFVNDFLQLIYNQINSSIQTWNIGTTFNIGYIDNTNQFFFQMDETFYQNYFFEISPSLALYLNVNITSSNSVIFNPVAINNLVSSYSIANWQNINPYKAIYLISYNSEFEYVSFQTNTTVSSLVPSQSVGAQLNAIYYFTNQSIGPTNNGTFFIDLPDPIKSGVRFQSDTVSNSVLKFSVKIQLNDNITFLDYPFAQNECVDLYTYLYQEQYNIF